MVEAPSPGRLHRDVPASPLLHTRTVSNEIPPRVDYEATAKVHELAPVFDTLNDLGR